MRELPTNGRDPLTYHDPLRQAVRAIKETSAPVLAMVEGSVWGGACELVMSCDLVVAAEGATFALTPAKLGVPYDIAGVREPSCSQSACRSSRKCYSPPSRCPPSGRAGGDREPGGPGRGSGGHDRRAGGPDGPEFAVGHQRLEGGAAHPRRGGQALNPDAFERIQGLRRRISDSADYQEGIRSFFERRAPRFEGH